MPTTRPARRVRAAVPRPAEPAPARRETPTETSTETPRRAPKARKNMRLDQSLLDAARQALGVADETEAVTVALERVVANTRAADAIRAWGGGNGLDASRIED